MTGALTRPGSMRLTAPIVLSALFHTGVVASFLLYGADTVKPLPPIYRVELIAAPAGPRAEGVVGAPPVPVAKVPAKAPAAAQSEKSTDTRRAKRTERPIPAATQNVSTVPPPQALPTAGSGAVGGRGADVVSVNTAGIEFPFPVYLSNIVRQIALEFEAPTNSQSLSAEVSFLINRDGSVTGIRLLKSSGSFVFNQSAIGAVESAGRSGKFGNLPREFSDDVLPVIFSFDPKRMR